MDFDGGGRNNLGIGGSGALLLLVRAGSCSVLARRSDFLGDNITNNFAEFSGLNSRLQLALDFLAQSADPVPGLRVTATGLGAGRAGHARAESFARPGAGGAG